MGGQIRSTGGGGEQKTKTIRLEPTDLSPCRVSEGGLVLTGLQRNHSGPLPPGRRPCLLARGGWKHRLSTCPSPSDSLLTDSTLASGAAFTERGTLVYLLTLTPRQWLATVLLSQRGT